MSSKKTLVIGASTNPERYSYKAIKSLLAHGHEVVGIGAAIGKLDGVPIANSIIPYNDIHTVTLYINPKFQVRYYDYLIKMKPQRIIFNPGTENEELENLCAENGIETLEACTLVMLSIGNY